MKEKSNCRDAEKIDPNMTHEKSTEMVYSDAVMEFFKVVFRFLFFVSSDKYHRTDSMEKCASKDWLKCGGFNTFTNKSSCFNSV